MALVVITVLAIVAVKIGPPVVEAIQQVIEAFSR